eukprot:9283275-Karenia_brevis.AAC.1
MSLAQREKLGQHPVALVFQRNIHHQCHDDMRTRVNRFQQGATASGGGYTRANGWKERGQRFG